MARAEEIREQLGDPEHVLLGVDRLDYTKGIDSRLQAFGELLAEGRLSVEDTVLVQVATPSRERVEQYRRLRDDVDARSAGSTATSAGSASRPCTTCTSPTRDRAGRALPGGRRDAW